MTRPVAPRQSSALGHHVSGFDSPSTLEIPRPVVIIARPPDDDTAVKPKLIASADPDRLETWARYSKGLCQGCRATCCTLPVEVRIDDLIRLEVVDAFERDEPPRNIARRLAKAGIVEHFNQKHGLFTLTRLANGDCLYLDRKSRLCTVYTKRPDTCRNHPQVGPRPGYCAYQEKTPAGR